MARKRKQANGEQPGIGHNSVSELGAYIDRIERLEEEKATFTGDIRDVYTEAKLAGFDPATMRRVVRMRRQNAAERAEQEALLDTYMHALGMLSDLPLGQAAIQRDLGAGPEA